MQNIMKENEAFTVIIAVRRPLISKKWLIEY
jgi:hypothetical protein